MANLDFYALADDQRDLVRYLFAETNVVMYELSSEFDHEIRRFRSLAELEAVFSLGAHPAAYLRHALTAVQNGAGLQLGRETHRADSPDIRSSVD